MSWDVYTETKPVARKDYLCNACEIITDNSLGERDFSPEEWIVIELAKSEGFKILKGTKYIKVKGIYEHEPSTFRARMDIDEICRENGFYED